MEDTLSEVLRGVRLTGAVFFAIDGAGSWVVEAAPSRVLVPWLMPGAGHLIEYHVITEGRAWAGIVDEAPVQVEAGDVVAFPQGHAHVVSSHPGMRSELSLDEWMVEKSRLPNRMSVGQGGEKTGIICGFLGCDARPFNPLLDALPRMIHLKGGGRPSGMRRAIIEIALAEACAQRPGGACALARVSELMFIELVRSHAESLPEEHHGWFAGLREPSVGRALGLLHARPTDDWTLESLARAVGVSRTVLAERFSQLVGAPPIQYLAQWRIQLAANLLRGGSASLAEIAVRVGYGSEGALSRAFKRLSGVSPADYRRTAVQS